MDPDPLASAETITLSRSFSAAGDTNQILDITGATFRLGYSHRRDIFQGQIDEKCGALADVAFDTDGAGMCRDDLSRDVETETKAAKATDRACAFEAVEDSRLIRFGNPGSGVSK